MQNLKKKLNCGLKNDMRNLVNFSASSGKSENLHFKVVLKFQLKSTEEWSLMTLKKHANFEEKLTFCLKNDMRNLVNFNTSTGKSENLHFDGLLLWKVGNVWAKKYRGVVSWKMTYGFKNGISHLVNFTQVVESNVR